MLASQVDYDDLFKLFMTSKMPNPHYLPEVAIKTTIINFTVTMEGLEDQLLGDVDTSVETSSALQFLVCRGRSEVFVSLLVRVHRSAVVSEFGPKTSVPRQRGSHRWRRTTRSDAVDAKTTCLTR